MPKTTNTDFLGPLLWPRIHGLSHRRSSRGISSEVAAVGSKRPVKDDRRSGSGASSIVRQKEKLRMRSGTSVVHWHWRPGRLGSDDYMRGLGVKLMYETEGGDAHVW